MKKRTVTIFLFVILCQSILLAKTDPNNKTKSQVDLLQGLNQNNQNPDQQSPVVPTVPVIPANTEKPMTDEQFFQSLRERDKMASGKPVKPDAQLLEAVKNVDPDSIKQALAAGANPNWVSDTPGKRSFSVISNLLIFANSITPPLGEVEKDYRCLYALNLLFDAGGKLQSCDYDILFWPISDGFPKVVELLINKGANINTTIEGMTPIEWAEAYGEKPVVEVLLKYGAKPISKEQAAQNRFVQLAGDAFKENSVREMEKALQNGASVNNPNSRGDIALTDAITFAQEEKQCLIVCYLLQNGANPNLKAKRQKWSDCASIPLHQAVDIHGLMVQGKDGIEDKVVYQRLIIKLLLKAGAHVSSRGYKGMSPLHIAAKNNDTYMADVLIKAGAKIMDRDDSGKTPLDYAESAEMIKLLKSQGAKEQ